MPNNNYYNKAQQSLYVLHFPGTGLEGHIDMVQKNLDRTFFVSEKISIISIMNEQCYKDSFIAHQCKKNNVHIYNSALEEINWKNTVKIQHILKCLNEINTEYALILDGRDTLIVNNLLEDFIQTYKEFNKPIVYNGTSVAYPNVPIEDIKELIHIRGKQRYLNAGVCFGEKNALLSFYEKANKIKETLINNNSEQLIIRMCRCQNPEMVAIDYNNELFRIVHNYDTNIIEMEGDNYILI